MCASICGVIGPESLLDCGTVVAGGGGGGGTVRVTCNVEGGVAGCAGRVTEVSSSDVGYVQVAVLVRLVSGYQVNCSREVKVREVAVEV